MVRFIKIFAIVLTSITVARTITYFWVGQSPFPAVVLLAGFLMLLYRILEATVKPLFIYSVYRERLYILTKQGTFYTRDIDSLETDGGNNSYIDELPKRYHRRVLRLVQQYLKKEQKKQG